ncbi:MAG: peptidoglycan DD-metalloendopeptidase family protein [Propionibacteriaceae bacterium]|nr:peptidoglycan DD-metalloendopeptidase family protein [Propionibacteriaceae bacterium]
MRTLFILLVALLMCAGAMPASANAFSLSPPLPGRILRGFDDVGRFEAGHRGVDIAGYDGEQVLAAAPGVVHFAGSVAGRPTVSIDHGNGWRTTYQPVRGTWKKGDVVQEGDPIGVLVAGHCPEEACLHWGLTDGVAYADPTAYLEVSVVRLLPKGAQPPSPPSIQAARVAGTVDSLPVAGHITSKFGMRRHPVTGVYKLHDGVDFGAACGTSITLPAAGVVTSAGYHGGYGYRVVVDHGGGLVTAYAHLPRVTVHPGERLTAGQSVGVVGNTGLSTGCHLHWMAWQGGTLVDPLTLAR